MRWLTIFVFGIFLVSFALASVPYDCHENMVSYWQFEGDVLDSVGNNHGVAFGSSSFNSLGITLSSSDFLELPTPSVGSFTYGGQFKVSSYLLDGDVLFTKGLNLKLSQVDNYLVLSLGSLSLNSTILSSDYNSFPNLLFSLFLTYDGSQAILYLDGSEVDRGDVVFNWVQGNVSFEGNTEFDLSLDELAFFNKALSSTEISDLYDLSNGGNDYCPASTPSLPSSSTIEWSSTSTRFFVTGCTTDDGRELVVGTCGGDVFCQAGGVLADTLTDDGACLLGGGANGCCPSGYVCRDDGDGNGTICHKMQVDCMEYLTEEECEADHGKDGKCIWREGECYNPNDDALTCSLYTTKEGCEEDVWNFARDSKQAKSICGFYTKGYQTVPISNTSCICIWDNGQCKFHSEVYDIISKDGALKFDCSIYTEVGDCVNGKRILNVTATHSPLNFWEGKTEAWRDAQLADAGCASGEIEVGCGKPIVQLPFFSIFSLLGVFAILGIFYSTRKI
jgi:hypothetical protein